MNIGAVTITNDADEYTVSDGAFSVNGYDKTGALALAVEKAMTNSDVDAWHEGDCTDHMRSILNDVERFAPGAVVQVWGSRDGVEPLSVTIHF